MKKIIKRKNIYKGKIINLNVDSLKINNKNFIREIIIHPGSVVIIPVLDIKKQKIIMIKQFRYAINKYIYELPAGTKEKNENSFNCAKRELEEETGYYPEKLKKLITIYPSPGIISEKMDIFLATSLKKKKQNLEQDENIKIKIFTLNKLINMIFKGKIVDGKTIVGILLLNKIKEKFFK